MFEGFASITNGRYRVVLEESWYHERSEVRSPAGPVKYNPRETHTHTMHMIDGRWRRTVEQ